MCSTPARATRGHPLRFHAAALAALSVGVMLAWPQAGHARALAEPDLAAQRDPVTLRLALDAQQLAQTRLHVPPGTRAYLIGDAAAPRGRIAAWYRTSDGRLLAAVHVSPIAAHPATSDGVKVHAGAGHQGRSPALLEVATTRDLPQLAAAPEFSVQPAGAPEQAVAPLLSYRGSTHVLALAPAMDQTHLRSGHFDVRTRGANGAVESELPRLPSQGGSPPITVSGAATQPGVPSELFAANAGTTARVLQLEPRPPLRWADTALAPQQTMSMVLPAGARSPVGAVVSSVAGAFNLVYRDQPVNDAAGGQFAAGPVVADRAGNASVPFTSQTPIAAVELPPVPQVPARSASVAQQPSMNAGGSSRHLHRVAIAGAAAGVLAVMLVDREGRRQPSEVAIVPLEEDTLQAQRELVTIETVQSGGETWYQDKKPCECEKLTVKPEFGDDKRPKVTVTSSAGGANDSILSISVTASWVASITCTAGDGECSDSLELSATSSDWKVDKNAGTPLPKSEKFVEGGQAGGGKAPSSSIVCSGPCGKETSTTVTTQYDIKVANGKLRGKAPNEFGGGGQIGKGASSGKVTLKLMPKKCAGSGWTMVLQLGGTGGDVDVVWERSDRDGDGRPDSVDKIDDPTAKPAPKIGPKK